MPTRPQLPGPPGRVPPQGRPPATGTPPAGPPGDPDDDARDRGGRGKAAAPPALRLAIGRDGIGVELAEPVELGCLRVVELSTTLPGMRFPVDVSGGVSRFRHRRGDLQILRVEVAGRDVERWMAPRVRGLVGTRTPDVWIEVGRARSTVCVAALLDAEERASGHAPGAAPHDAPIVAFDVLALAETEDIVLVVTNARGAGLPEPATAMALACAEAVLGNLAERSGAIFRLRRPAAALTRALLPAAGARVPSTEAVRWASLGADAGTWLLHASRAADPDVPAEAALRAREIAALLAPGDEALLRGDRVTARAHYLEVLERAPRHAEVAARLVDIDARVPARAEAALATLVESQPSGGGTGIVAGELLARVGDGDAALASFERAGEAERAPALAARAFELAARASRDAEAAARWLDRALARSPRSIQARWARVESRLALGRLEDALADVEHLEALARGGRGKYAVWVRAGGAWQAAGLGGRTGVIFERALRYAPDEAGALVGLALALLGEGRGARGVALLERALEVARVRGQPESPIRLALAEALAERLDDPSTAIAHVSAIPATSPEALVARGLEGRWRARLGDLAGAALAFARLRDFASSLAPAADGPPARTLVALLLEAAALERDRRSDPLAAQRHLAAALRLLPHHVETRRAYREVGARVLRAADAAPAGYEGEPAATRENTLLASIEPPAAREPTLDLSLDEDVGADGRDVVRTLRVEELTRRLRDAPGDDAIADELAALLEDLGRGHELVAVLAGRLEDAPADRRPALAVRALTVLERMASRAEASGQSADASLYRDAIAALS
jgi:cellulose synthase operon protein C